MTSDTLGGARVALLEARMESELASLVRRHGGEPVCVPALREVERDCAGEAARAIDALARPGALVILATGVGLARWLKIADGLDRGAELRAGLAGATLVCRGPKPVAVLKREGLQAQVRAPAPHTTRELLEALAPLEVRDHDAVFVHDGGGSRGVPEALAGRGARTLELQPYAWALPEDVGPLQQLVGALVAGEVRALAVTTQMQARNLFQVAEAMGASSALREALRARVVVAAVGPTCAHALEELGAPAQVMPDTSKMGALVIALTHYLATRPSNG